MGIIFDIQTYSIYDGPGIRTTVFFKGCPLKCVWCHNPESQRLDPHIAYTVDKCTRCGACVEACPRGAIQLSVEGIVRDDSLCIVCGECAAACGFGATEKIGEDVSPEYILEKVIADRPFYETSGGGVTVTGGEATLQPDFLVETLSLIKENSISTALETAGLFNIELIDRLKEVVDLFLFDIKQIDSKIHRELTGVPNEKILKNFKEILNGFGCDRIIPRIPLIPNFNADDESMKKIASFLVENGYDGPVHLMPYNSLAKSKYEKVGMGKLYRDMGSLEKECLESIVSIFSDRRFEVVVNH